MRSSYVTQEVHGKYMRRTQTFPQPRNDKSLATTNITDGPQVPVAEQQCIDIRTTNAV